MTGLKRQNNNQGRNAPDAEPCDIPEGCRLDVRVQMPENSIWNQQQQKLAESK
ncbi:hypothetical protein PXH59_18005 [Xenorhabdus sp. SF857]|uniref:phage tail fiber protein n=1 Tax=Xenorhabdus bakwenae TaxID=3026967 RepID=UPI00255805B1|nr:hypothetical protein [Xenorhabdus sp. SF857]WFQ79432.1 hypothetical protein PXH59_18005 [Xenorhabdus sp. SF857]